MKVQYWTFNIRGNNYVKKAALNWVSWWETQHEKVKDLRNYWCLETHWNIVAAMTPHAKDVPKQQNKIKVDLKNEGVPKIGSN